jgi:hypothetical protein
LLAFLESLEPSWHKTDLGDKVAMRVSIPHSVVMWVIDGQHRRWAMAHVVEFLRHVQHHQAYPKKGSLFPYNGNGPAVSKDVLPLWRECLQIALTHCTVTVEAHVNLTAAQQRQLFHDLNNLGKRVEAGTAFGFDNSNPVNLFIKNHLIESSDPGLKVVDKDIVDWSEHDGSIARKDIVAVNAILFLNKTNVRGATPPKVAKMEATAMRYWRAVKTIPGFGEAGAKQKTVAAQPVVLKALAKLVYDFSVGKWADTEQLDDLVEGISSMDFSHENRIWRYYTLDEQGRDAEFPGLKDFLPPDADGNRDIGSVDENGMMRFGAKHNDIYPIIGDMVRWKLNLPNRHVKGEPEIAA